MTISFWKIKMQFIKNVPQTIQIESQFGYRKLYGLEIW